MLQIHSICGNFVEKSTSRHPDNLTEVLQDESDTKTKGHAQTLI